MITKARLLARLLEGATVELVEIDDGSWRLHIEGRVVLDAAEGKALRRVLETDDEVGYVL